MHNSQGSAKDLFIRNNSQMDAFEMALSQDWKNSLSQESRSLPVPCTPSNIFRYQGSAEGVSQANIPPYLGGYGNFGTPSLQGKDLRENRLSRKIWVGLTAVFNIVSELPEKLKVNDSGISKEIRSISEELTKLLEEKANEKSLFSEFKLQRKENAEQFLKIYNILHALNEKVSESQELFQTFQKSLQSEISGENGILLRKLSKEIRDSQMCITDFQKMQNYTLSLKNEEVVNSQGEILNILKEIVPSVNNFVELDKKWELKFDSLTTQLMDMKTMVRKICDFNNSQIAKKPESLRPNLRICSQNGYFPKVESTPLAMKARKESPVAHVQPFRNMTEVRNENKEITLQPTKRSLDIICYNDRTKDAPVRKVKDIWCELTPEWRCCNDRMNSIKKQKIIQHEPNVVTDMNSTGTSHDENYLPKGINKSKKYYNQDQFFPSSRPMSRLNCQNRFFPKE